MIRGKVNDEDSLWSKIHLKRILQIGLNSFLIYFAIYGFRKPWGAARFKGQHALGMKLKDAFSMFQTLGYALGKVVGTFVVPLIPSEKTTMALVLLPPVSVLFWFGFALSENSTGWMVFFMFFSAMPLSFGWSLLYRKIEGRRTGDVLGAILMLQMRLVMLALLCCFCTRISTTAVVKTKVVITIIFYSWQTLLPLWGLVVLPHLLYTLHERCTWRTQMLQKKLAALKLAATQKQTTFNYWIILENRGSQLTFIS
jgi:hypothetical protein